MGLRVVWETRRSEWIDIASWSAWPGGPLAQAVIAPGKVTVSMLSMLPGERHGIFSKTRLSRDLAKLGGVKSGSVGVYWQDHKQILGDVTVTNMFRDELHACFLDNDSVMGRVSAGSHDLMKSALVEAAAWGPNFAYSVCRAYTDGGGMAATDCLYRFGQSSDVIDGYSWMLLLSAKFADRLSPVLLADFHHEVVSSAHGEYLFLEMGKEPADVSIERLREWKGLLAPILPVREFKESRPFPPVGVLPEDWSIW